MTITAAIIQARMNSTRLPGKILLDLDGQTVLSHVLDRCKAIKGVDIVCCAIPEGKDSDPIAIEAQQCGVNVFRGSESDVLDRYHQAAISVEADTVMRVTSDCPVIDPAVCAGVLRLFNETSCGVAVNNAPPSWPHGLDCEVFSAGLLAHAADEATDPFEREHVSPWMRGKNSGANIKNFAAPQGGIAQHRWTLDTPADYEFLCRLFERMPAGVGAFDYQVALKIVEEDPELAAINMPEESRL